MILSSHLRCIMAQRGVQTTMILTKDRSLRPPRYPEARATIRHIADDRKRAARTSFGRQQPSKLDDHRISACHYRLGGRLAGAYAAWANGNTGRRGVSSSERRGACLRTDLSPACPDQSGIEDHSSRAVSSVSGTCMHRAGIVWSGSLVFIPSGHRMAC
jgi:hypothetical protein